MKNWSKFAIFHYKTLKKIFSIQGFSAELKDFAPKLKVSEILKPGLMYMIAFWSVLGIKTWENGIL